MKKLVFVLTLFIFCLTACFLASCSTHTCDFCVKSVDKQYLKAVATCEFATEYFFSCECGNKGEKTFFDGQPLGHNLTTHQQKAPTCTEEGYKEYQECLNCDYTTFEAIPNMGHDYKNINTVEPTCKVEGYTEYSCDCGESFRDNYKSVVAHQEQIDEAVAPTCSQTGLTQGSHCLECGDVINAQQVVGIDKNNHKSIPDQGYPKTCTTDGLTDGSHCEWCKSVLVEQEVIPKSHDTIVDQAIPATCDKDGLTEGSHCGECGEVILAQEIAPKKGHDLKQGLCSRCDYEYYTEGITFAKNHTTDTYSVESINVSGVHDVVIPSKYNGKLVTDVLGYVVRGGEVTSITLPKTIKSIQYYAFYNCTSLTNIYFNGTVEDWCNVSVWGDTSFGNVQNFYVLDDNGSVSANERKYSLLTNLVIPSSVKTVKAYQFYSFNCITSVKMEEGVQEVMDYAFFACTNLQAVTLAKSTQSIGINAFAYCSNLSTIYIFGKLSKIGGNAFSNCTNLQTVYYEKTQQEWQQIDIAFGNDYLTRAQIIYDFLYHN